MITIADKSSKSAQLTGQGGASISTSVFKFGGGSLFLNGEDSYVVYPANNSDFGAFGQRDFTIEWWEYIVSWGDNPVSDLGPIISYGMTNIFSPATPSWYVSYDDNGASLIFNINGINFTFFVDETPLNVWRHCAIVKKNNIINYFRDGVKHPSNFNGSFVNVGTTSNASLIGGIFQGEEDSQENLISLNGFIDDLRITKNIARYSQNFDPPVEEAPTMGFPDLEILFDNNNIVHQGSFTGSSSLTVQLQLSGFFNPGQDYDVELNGVSLEGTLDGNPILIINGNNIGEVSTIEPTQTILFRPNIATDILTFNYPTPIFPEWGGFTMSYNNIIIKKQPNAVIIPTSTPIETLSETPTEPPTETPTI
jgi:hypothetical protein